MTARPFNYGDPRPSDAGDNLPNNPSDGYAEIDYFPEVEHFSGKRRLREEVPDLRTRLLSISKKPEMMGVVVAKLPTKGQYTIMRQDGLKGIGYLQGDDRRYAELAIGEHVKLTETTTPYQWLIEGSRRNLEYSSLDAYNASQVGPTNTEVAVSFTDVTTRTGTTVALQSGGVKFSRDASGLFQIDYSATVECTNPKDEEDEAGLGTIQISTSCGASTAEGGNAQKIRLYRENGFYLNWEPSEYLPGTINVDRATIALYCDEPGFVLASSAVWKDGEGRERNAWTDTLRLGNGLEVPYFVMIGGNVICKASDGNMDFIQLPNRMISPDEVGFNVGAGSHLIVEGTANDNVNVFGAGGVKLGYTPKGIHTGFTVKGYDDKPISLAFRYGVLVSISGATYTNPTNKGASLSFPQESWWSC